MGVRKVTFRLNDTVSEDKAFLDWLDEVYVDRTVPLKVLLLPLIRRGVEASKQDQLGERKPSLKRDPKRRQPEKMNGTTHRAQSQCGIGDESADKPHKAEGAEDFPLDKLSFD